MKGIYEKLPRVAPALLAIIVDYAGFGFVYPLVTAIFGDAGIFGHVLARHFYQGLAYLLYPLFMFFGASMLGDLSDKYGRKRILLLALGGIFICYLLMGFSLVVPSLSLFLVMRALSGLFAGCQPLAQAAVADISTHEDKKWNMALITLANNIGLIFGPLVVGFFTLSFFLEKGGYIYAFLFIALVTLIAFIWLFRVFNETYTTRSEKKIGFFRPVIIFVDAFRDRHLRPLVIILFCFQLSVAIFYQILAIYLASTYEFSSSELGFFYGFIGVFFILGVVAIYPFMLHRMTLPRLILYGFFGEGIMMFLAGAIPNLFFIFLFSALFAIFNIFAWTGFLSYYSERVDKDRQGWAMGVFTSMVAVGFMLAGWTTNLLPWAGARSQVTVSGLISVVTGFLFLFYHLTTGRDQISK